MPYTAKSYWRHCATCGAYWKSLMLDRSCRSCGSLNLIIKDPFEEFVDCEFTPPPTEEDDG